MRSQLLILGLFATTLLKAQAESSWKFDMGIGKPQLGYVKVKKNDYYTTERGFGWMLHPLLKSYKVGKQKTAAADGIESSEPYYFSVAVPEGNYRVKLVLGGSTESASTVVRVENRRWMAGAIETEPGQQKTVEFLVHVKDSLIRDKSGLEVDQVKLKPREVNYPHWDNQLTVEFNGEHPQVALMEIEKIDSCVQVFLAGDSTVVDQDKEPWASWGQMIPHFFRSDKVVVANYAESGEALNSFKSAKRLKKLLSLMHTGDYLFIEFGHNDQKQTGSGSGPWGNYKKLLEEYITLAKEKGGIPVLVTSMNRRSFDTSGKIINTLGDYPTVVRQVALEQKVALIDLNAMSKQLYEAWGEKNSVKAFVHYPANSFPGQVQELKDNTHFNTYGAWQLAKCIAKGIREAGLPLANELKMEEGYFDPSRPDGFESWYWPLSIMMTVSKPDGN